MTVKITWKRAGLATLAAALIVLGISFSGVVTISASSGHWAPTRWFLHWTMRNSVRTHAAFQSPGDPADAAGLVSAAGHFAQSCAACHGAPGERPSPVMQAATPAAPDLAVHADDWSDAELFWIVRHGVKFSGMPAWPAFDRTDEVTRMAAFVRRLPAMSPAEYRALLGARRGAGGDGALRALNTCAGCHGRDGLGRGQPDIPVIAGQKVSFLIESLAEYRDGARHSAIMQTAAAGLEDREIRALAQYFAAMPGLRQPAILPVSRSRAAEIVTEGLPEKMLPACASCHTATADPRYPIIAGQKAAYMAARLHRWQSADAGMEPNKPATPMAKIARRIPPEDIDALARFWSGLPVQPSQGP